MVEGGVEVHAAGEFRHLQSALVFQRRVTDEERGAAGGVADGVDADGDVAQTDGLIAEPAVFQVEASHLVYGLAEVDQYLSGHGPAQGEVHVERVVGQVQGDVGLVDCEAVGVDAPPQV